MVVSLDELEVSIEQRFEELSGEAERLRAALDALDSAGMPRASSSLPGRTVARAGTRHAVLKSVAGRQAGRVDHGPGDRARPVRRRPNAPPDPEGVVVETGERGEGVAIEPAGEGSGSGSEEMAPGTGADRAVQSLRRELAAGLRTSRL